MEALKKYIDDHFGSRTNTHKQYINQYLKLNEMCSQINTNKDVPCETFIDLIKKSPIEYNWYGEWLLESKVIPLIEKPTIFKNIFFEDQYNSLIKRGLTKEDLAKKYMGINLQTSLTRQKKIVDYEL